MERELKRKSKFRILETTVVHFVKIVLNISMNSEIEEAASNTEELKRKIASGVFSLNVNKVRYTNSLFMHIIK